MTLLTLPSLPGMAWLDNTTTSFSFSFNHLFSPRAISPSADIGSPCEPVEMMHTLPGSYLSMSSMSTIDDSGRSRMPEIETEPHVLLHAQPSVATTRPSAMAALAICWMRCRWLAKLAVMIRLPRCWVNRVRSTLPTLVSLGAYPASSAFVESLISSRMPGSFAS